MNLVLIPIISFIDSDVETGSFLYALRLTVGHTFLSGSIFQATGSGFHDKLRVMSLCTDIV